MVQRITHHLENEAQLNECNVALDHTMDVFTFQTDLETAAAIAKMKISGAEKHEELLDKLTTYLQRSGFASSGSKFLSILLPGSPQIFRGREAELTHLISHLLSPEPSQNAILEPGGIGKSSLALAYLYQPEVIAA
ncbi:hypothetical protein DFH09DRAFT_1371053 [Mycena vulgaris]|nr:hypothetical protein DFH09DRAFT_1371053 [Mycena vulgaris]